MGERMKRFVPGQTHPYLIYWCNGWNCLQTPLPSLTKPIAWLPMAVWLGQVGEERVMIIGIGFNFGVETILYCLPISQECSEAFY